MSKAIYAKLWMSTSQYHLRREYGWVHLWKRLAPWALLYGTFGIWAYFPAFSDDTKKIITLGIWEPSTVGYFKSKPT